MGHVAEQLRQTGIREAICTRSANFPVRVPFQTFLARWGYRMGAAKGPHTSGVRLMKKAPWSDWWTWGSFQVEVDPLSQGPWAWQPTLSLSLFYFYFLRVFLFFILT